MHGAMIDFDQATHAQVAALLGAERAADMLGLLHATVATLFGMAESDLTGPSGLALVHRLKSEAGLMGFDRLSRACKAVDATGSLGNVSSSDLKNLREAMTWALLVIETLDPRQDRPGT